MKKGLVRYMRKGFAVYLVIAVIAALVIVGGVYAYQTYWSGSVGITILPPTSSANLEITEVFAVNGVWDVSSETWTVSIPRGGEDSLGIGLENTGGDFVTVSGYVSNGNPAPGVTVYGEQTQVIAAGGSTLFQFFVVASTDAQVGTLPQIQLEIRAE